MSFINYYPNQKKSEFSYSTVLYTAVLTTSLVCVLWYSYAINYRYSSDRIEDKLLRKYDKPIGDNQTINARNGQINSAKTMATAIITVSDKGMEYVPSKSEVFSLPVISNCKPTEKTCISL